MTLGTLARPRRRTGEHLTSCLHVREPSCLESGGMDDDEVFDRLSEIDMSASATKAEDFEALAQSMPVGEHGRATFLVSSGQHRQMNGEYDEAHRCYSLALEDGGRTTIHPVANLLSLALDTGDESTVDARSAELRGLVRADRLGPAACHFVGGSFRHHGRLREALRWFTIPLTYADLEEDDLDLLCLTDRFLVRRELEMPEDRLDQIAAVEMEQPY